MSIQRAIILAAFFAIIVVLSLEPGRITINGDDAGPALVARRADLPDVPHAGSANTWSVITATTSGCAVVSTLDAAVNWSGTCITSAGTR